MSWLRDHFHNFVFPAFVAAEKRSDLIGEPFDVRPSEHAPAKLPPELRKLWTLCKDHEVPFEFDVREINVHGGTSKYREKAKVDHDILNTTLDSALAALKHEGCSRLFLGGRDVWAFAVQCERRRIPYMFVPELSRHVSGLPEVKGFLESRGFRGDELFLDTGFEGSIPRNLARHFPGKEFKFRLMSQKQQFFSQEGGIYDSDEFPHRVLKKDRWKRYPNQLFPNRKTAREEALYQEYVAKFWKSGTFSEPITSAPLGCAPSVFKEWLQKTNIWRYEDAKHRHLCITDGNEAIAVALTDLKIAPGFHEWWKSLPQGHPWMPKDQKPGEIIQFLSDKQSIQRAALLTSQIWRGIPYWRHIGTEKSPAKTGIFTTKGNSILNTTGISNLTMLNSTSSSMNAIWMPGSKVPTIMSAPGFVAVQSEAGQIEIKKAQLDLFEDFKTPSSETELLFDKIQAFADVMGGDCPDGKSMTEDTFLNLTNQVIT